MQIINMLQQQFDLKAKQVSQTLALLDEGNTIPFIARYRKEITGNLDDQTLRQLADSYQRLQALAERRKDILRLLTEMDLLDEDLRNKIQGAQNLTDLEDLYRPYRPKRKTRASLAIARGLTPLADLILAQELSLAELRQRAVELWTEEQNSDLASKEAVIDGALDILAERLSDDAWVRRRLRKEIWQQGLVETRAVDPSADSVFRDYYEYVEPVAKIASHRVLAINRGEKEKYLRVSISLNDDQIVAILNSYINKNNTDYSDLLQRMAADAWKRLLKPSLENENRQQLTEMAEEKSIDVFRENLRSLLMQAPVKGFHVLGFDPAFRTGCKLAVVDDTGRLLATDVIYPHQPQKDIDGAKKKMLSLIEEYQVEIIAIGNGTASRESEFFVRDLIKDHKLSTRWIIVSEAGASVYSASKLAAEEFPDFDVSLRSAVSIARRLQDPLAELVKIEPKAIGVGQYQHDLNQKELDKALGGVVEACVNEVGVDLNTASPSLLGYVAGLTAATAKNIVAYRNDKGPFDTRQELLKVARLGPKAYEQCAGFLRIPNALEPLDNTSIHPESYEKVHQLSRLLQLPPSPELAIKATEYDPAHLANQLDVGQPTLTDIIAALKQPGRDPREDLPQAALRQDLLELKDLKANMILEGVVRNVAAFGAFVDVGVEQDGLVHISELADYFVRDPLSVVKVGQIVKVRIINVDQARNRISLSMKKLTKGEISS